MPTKVRNGNHAASRGAAHAADEITELLRGLEQANANTKAVVQVVNNLSAAANTHDAAKAALDTVKDAFGWAYGSCWVRDEKENALKFAVESGSVNEDFRRVTMEARFREGEGLSGRCLEKSRPLFRRRSF